MTDNNVNQEDEINLSSGKGFEFNSMILHDTTKMKIIAEVTAVPDKATGAIHHYTLRLKKLTKNPSQDWSDSEVAQINLTSDKPESLNKLIGYLKAQPQLAKYWGNNVTLSIDKVKAKEDKEFIDLLLSTFDTPEKRELLVQAKKEDVNNLYASVKFAKNKKAVAELENLMNGISTPESEYQSWIQNNPWVFGSEYLEISDVRKIGLTSESDFIAISLDSYADIIEIKKSDFKLFNYDNSHKCYYPHSELSKAIGQAVHYLHVMEREKVALKEEYKLDILKPRIKIVIGRSSLLNKDEKRTLRLLNHSLHNIEVITYDEIFKRAEKYTRIVGGKKS